MDELARGGSVTMAVGFADQWLVPGDRCPVTSSRYKVTCDMLHMTIDRYI